MLRDELRAAAPSLRTARASGACPTAVFSAYLSTARERDALLAALPPLGLDAQLRGKLALICPLGELGRALGELAAGRAPEQLPALGRIYPQPAQLCLEHTALLRGMERLPGGFDEAALPLIAHGLRLTEGPDTPAERRAYMTRVRQEAARALRLRLPGDALRACAYLIVQGGMVYEA